MPFDASQQPPPIYVAPMARRPTVLVDQYRVMLADPQGYLLGSDGNLGAQGHLGRLAYAQRTPANRGY